MSVSRPPPERTAATLDDEPEEALSRREQLALRMERWLDPPMAVLAVVWAVLVAYQLVAPDDQRGVLSTANSVLWVVFLVEFVSRLAVDGNPLRYLRRRWPTLVFLALPALRLARLVPAVRALRLLPAAQVVGTSYRALGTARSLLGGRLTFLSVATLIVVFSGGQLLYLLEGRLGPGLAGRRPVVVGPTWPSAAATSSSRPPWRGASPPPCSAPTRWWSSPRWLRPSAPSSWSRGPSRRRPRKTWRRRRRRGARPRRRDGAEGG